MSSTHIGKQIADRCYVHVSGIDALDDLSMELASRAMSIAGITAGHDFNVVRIRASTSEVALLDYAEFFSLAFPTLAKSWRVLVPGALVRYRDYSSSLNPPILHRKELLLPVTHPAREQFATVTSIAESLGLFDDPIRIGFKGQWQELLRRRGYSVVGHDFLPIGNAEPSDDDLEILEFQSVQRHLTALSRTSLSAPIQCLLRDELLTAGKTFFDYGCGKGDDLRGLATLNITGNGWDPHHYPAGVPLQADIVNLGFVINVIEDFDERVDALLNAFALCRHVLAVSAMLDGAGKPGRPFRDGVLTGRNTFQKYFTQVQLQQFLESVLDEEAIAAAPGVFYVFRDRLEEQRFLLRRQSSRVRRSRAVRPAIERPGTPYSEKSRQLPDRTRPRALSSPRRTTTPVVDPEMQTIASTLWELCMALGRAPEPEEVDTLGIVEARFGSLDKAIRYCFKNHDRTALERCAEARRDELLVGLAASRFSRRRRLQDLEIRLQRDIKALFGSLVNAEHEAQALLFSVGDSTALSAACEQAATLGLGHLEQGQSLQLHTSLIERLPAILRVYIACATSLFGDARDVDLVKLHIGSGKVTLMRYDDFVGKPLPAMTQRIKVKLKEQDLDVFLYGEEFEKPLLYEKSRFINEEFPNYPEQVVFEETLRRLGLIDVSGYGPSGKNFQASLARARWEIHGFSLQRCRSIPGLDDACSQYFRFRDLIEVSDTWKRTHMENAPRLPETFNALADLARLVLDPVVDYFGKIEITYGFCSAKLARQIEGRIDPKLDQHAGYELNARGRRICDRDGAAVDFIVTDENMREVVQWIEAHVPFDRLYYYGEFCPIHVSFGPEERRELIEMEEVNGRRLPRRRRRHAGTPRQAGG